MTCVLGWEGCYFHIFQKMPTPKPLSHILTTTNLSYKTFSKTKYDVNVRVHQVYMTP